MAGLGGGEPERGEDHRGRPDEDEDRPLDERHGSQLLQDLYAREIIEICCRSGGRPGRISAVARRKGVQCHLRQHFQASEPGFPVRRHEPLAHRLVVVR